jgi:hypothetical protein
LNTVSIDECEVAAIRNAIAAMYRGDTGELEAANGILRSVAKRSLVAFVLDAFNRGWISPFNLGIADDGRMI